MTSEHQTLTEFLEARLEEDRALAQAAIDDLYGEDDCYFDTSNEHISSHYLHHQPSRVLREVEAKRALLAIHNARDSWGHCTGCGVDSDGSLYMVIDDCPTLKALAAVYSDHPDFDPNWSTT